MFSNFILSFVLESSDVLHNEGERHNRGGPIEFLKGRPASCQLAALPSNGDVDEDGNGNDKKEEEYY